MGIFKFSDPPYGGSNEVFGKNQNFPLVLNIKLHLKMSVNYQLQISPPPNFEGLRLESILLGKELPLRRCDHGTKIDFLILRYFNKKRIE